MPYLRFLDLSCYENIIAFNIGPPDYSASSFQSQVLAAFNINLPKVKFISKPSLIKSLDVLPQRFGFYSKSIFPVDVLSDFKRVGHSILSQKNELLRALPRSVYVSKRRIGPVGSYLEEPFVESLLLNAGFDIIHPEIMSISEQLSIYNNAERIVFCEGSALHALLFVDLTGKDIFYISRRPDLKWIFDGQLLSQSCRRFKAISCVNRSIPISKNEWEDIMSLDVSKLIDEFKKLSLIPDDVYCAGIDEAEIRLNCFNSLSGNFLDVLKKKFIGY